MSPRALIEPKNLSNIFFTSNSWEDDFVGSLVPYVHPELVISTGESVSDGRGVIATASIKAGTCLFVTPPTVEANKLRVKEKFVVSASSDLAELSEEDLVRAMRTAMNRRDFERINSFLVLVGAETSNQAPCIQERDNLQYKLLGNCSEPLDEQIIRNVSDADLISIVRRNAFGPDFCTYDSLQNYWSRSADPAHLKEPPHLLAMYPFAAMLNHSCCPNAVRVYVKELMVVHACQDVDAGEEIVWSYVPPTMDHKRRRAILERQHGFICRCQRCLVEESLLASGVPPSVTEWNDRLVDVSALDDGQAQSLRSAFDSIDAMLWSTAAPFSNEAKRFLRVGYTCLQMNYLNLALAKLSNEQSIDDDRIRSSLLNLATQLHFSFCACHNGSTEDLSILHLCYEMITVLHQSALDKSATLPKLRFWTEQLKKAHMIRYGDLGSDLESVRKCMMHTRIVLRQKDGLLTHALYPFI